jgi:hypothetical protein
MKDIAILILIIAVIWYPFVECILYKYRSTNDPDNFSFFLHLTQTLIPIFLSVISAILYFFVK